MEELIQPLTHQGKKLDHAYDHIIRMLAVHYPHNMILVSFMPFPIYLPSGKYDIV